MQNNSAKMGRPSLVPGTYLRLLLIDSEQGNAWQTEVALGVRHFLRVGWRRCRRLSTISRTRRRNAPRDVNGCTVGLRGVHAHSAPQMTGTDP